MCDENSTDNPLEIYEAWYEDQLAEDDQKKGVKNNTENST